MENIDAPISLEEQVKMMKKYVVFRQCGKMRKFLSYAGYFRTSRYGKFLLSNVENVGSKSKQDALYQLYQFDVELRKVLNYYCNRVEVRFKSAISNACSLYLQDSTFYLDKQYYAPSKGERDAKKRKQNTKLFHNTFYGDLVSKEEKLRKDVVKYPELKEYRKGGSRQKNKLPIWVTFSYSEFGTMSKMYSYLRGDLRNYCAHSSMVVGITSSVVLHDPADVEGVLFRDNDLFSGLYALKKLMPEEDILKLKADLKKIIKRCKVDIYAMGILPKAWEIIYDEISIF